MWLSYKTTLLINELKNSFFSSTLLYFLLTKYSKKLSMSISYKGLTCEYEDKQGGYRYVIKGSLTNQSAYSAYVKNVYLKLYDDKGNLRALNDYYVKAEEIDDLSHYYMGKAIFEEQQRIIKKDYCVVDIETTGLNRTTDQIVEISAIKVRDDMIIDKFTRFIKPTISIPASATAINGITNKMVENAPNLRKVLLEFIKFVGGDVIIGHNVFDFDMQFLDIACRKEINQTFANDCIDTLQLARRAFKFVSNYKLATLCRELNIVQSEHRAEADCISTKELYDKIKDSITIKSCNN